MARSKRPTRNIANDARAANHDDPTPARRRGEGDHNQTAAGADKPGRVVKKLHVDHEVNAITLKSPNADPANIPVKLVRAGKRVGCAVLMEYGDAFPMPLDSAKDAINRGFLALVRAGGLFGFETDYEYARDPRDNKLWLFGFRDQLNYVSRHKLT